MSRILLDTSAYTAYVRGDADVVRLVQEAEAVALSATVLGELRAGFAAGTRREANEAVLRSFLAASRVEVVPVDAETSVFYAAVYASLRQAGRPIPTNDLWIASSAMQYGLVLVTRDVHFQAVPQVIVQVLP